MKEKIRKASERSVNERLFKLCKGMKTCSIQVKMQ